jgi:hypothetical protein
VHETEFRIQVVEIEMQTLALLAHHFETMRGSIAADAKRTTGFHCREDTNQTRGDAVPCGNRTRLLFLGGAAARRRSFFQINVGATRIPRQLLGVCLQLRRTRFDIGAELLEQHALLGQETCKRAVREKAVQMSFENHPVEGRERA